MYRTARLNNQKIKSESSSRNFFGAGKILQHGQNTAQAPRDAAAEDAEGADEDTPA